MTEEIQGDVRMETVKFGDSGNELVTTGDCTLKYCPDWTALRKKGRPKGNGRQKSDKEIAMAGNRKRNANKKTRSQYCTFCDTFGHMARKCTTCCAQEEEGTTGAI